MALIKKGRMVLKFQPEVPRFRLSSMMWDLAMVWPYWLDVIGLRTTL